METEKIFLCDCGGCALVVRYYPEDVGKGSPFFWFDIMDGYNSGPWARIKAALRVLRGHESCRCGMVLREKDFFAFKNFVYQVSKDALGILAGLEEKDENGQYS